MRINLTQEEFECLWEKVPSFKKRIFDALKDEDVTAPTGDSIEDAVYAQFGNIHKGSGGNFIAAIKFVRKSAAEHKTDMKVLLSDGRSVEIGSLSGAKRFVENFCMDKC